MSIRSFFLYLKDTTLNQSIRVLKVLCSRQLKGFFNKKLFHCGKLWLFGLFSGDKGDNINMWMIKIMIEANQIDMDALLVSKVDNIQKPSLSLKSGFFH